jgi:hypothetical protein
MTFTFWGQITNVVLAMMLLLVVAGFVPVATSIWKTWFGK